MFTARDKGAKRQLADLLWSGAIAVVGLGGGTIFRYLSRILFARWIGPSGYGSYTFAIAVAQLAAVVAGLGLGTGAIRFIPKYNEHHDWARLRGFVRRCRQSTSGLGAALAIFLSLAICAIRPSKLGVAAILLGAWLAPLLALSNLEAEIARAFNLVTLYLVPIVAEPLVTIVVGFVIMRATGSLTGVLAVGARGFSLMTTILLQMVGLRANLPQELRRSHASFETCEWLRSSMPLLLIAGFSVLLTRSDALIIGMLRDSREVGIYDAASSTAALVALVLNAINVRGAPLMATLFARGQRLELGQLVRSVTRLMFWSAVLCDVALVIWCEPILGFFGPEFVSGKWALMVLAAGQLVNAGSGPVGYLMIISGNERLSARVVGWSAVFNIVANCALVPFLGVLGAAIATSLAMASWNIALYLLVRQCLGIKLRRSWCLA